MSPGGSSASDPVLGRFGLSRLTVGRLGVVDRRERLEIGAQRLSLGRIDEVGVTDRALDDVAGVVVRGLLVG